MTPSGVLLSRALKGASVAAGAVNPFSDSTTTRQDMRDLWSVMPGGNTWLMRNLNDFLSSQFPKSETP